MKMTDCKLVFSRAESHTSFDSICLRLLFRHPFLELVTMVTPCPYWLYWPCLGPTGVQDVLTEQIGDTRGNSQGDREGEWGTAGGIQRHTEAYRAY